MKYLLQNKLRLKFCHITCLSNTKSDPAAKSMACLLKAMADGGMLTLRRDHADFRGNDPESDGATAYDNIRDACDGRPALR